MSFGVVLSSSGWFVPICRMQGLSGTCWCMQRFGGHTEILHTGWATGSVNHKLPLLGRIKSSFSSAALAGLCDGDWRRQCSAVCVSYHRRVINVLSASYSSICLLSGGCMIQDQFMSFFWNQMVARQQNECQPHINVKCSNHYMSTYPGCTASTAAEHRATDRQQGSFSQRNTEFRKTLILKEILGENKSTPYNKNMTRSVCHEIACNRCHESESCQI